MVFILLIYSDKPSSVKLSNEVENVQLPVHSSFEVRCFTNQRGYPTGRLQWIKNDIYISSSTGLLIESGNFVILYFSNLKKEDTGKYKCQIENSIGYQEKSLNLFIVGKYFIFN